MYWLSSLTVMGLLMNTSLWATVPDDHGTNADNIHFPHVDKSYLDQPPRYNLEQIQHLDVGLNKDQIRALLGNPHFNEGIFGSKKWNYVLDVYVPERQTYQRCQLRIDFDQQALAKAYYWKQQECHDLIHQRQFKTSNADVINATPNQESQASLLFAFDRYSVDALQAQSKSIEQIAQAIKDSKRQKVTIVGYADELGGDHYNKQLALNRAQTVSNLLLQHGIPSDYINVEAQGSTHAYQYCEGKIKNAQLIQCLAPNRRVNIHW